MCTHETSRDSFSCFLVTIYSRTSVARTLMARLPWLFLTGSRVPTKKSLGCRFGIILDGFPFYCIENGILCVLMKHHEIHLVAFW